MIPHVAGPCFFMEWDPRGTWNDMADLVGYSTDPAFPLTVSRS
jgi:hypothetical protein